MIDDNKKWMAKGKIGCTFAAMFAKNPKAVNWHTIVNPEQFLIPDDCAVLSLQFPGKTKEEVRDWALNNGFYEEKIDPGKYEADDSTEYFGLRYNIDDKVSWVQYFGPDSHAKTRQAPIPELCMCVKLMGLAYYKVGIKGILHLAHTSVINIATKAADILWESSHTNTAKRLGHDPTLREAAKTTYINENTDNRAGTSEGDTGRTV